MKEQLISALPMVVVTFIIALGSVAWLVPKIRAFALRVGAYQEGGKNHGSGIRQHLGALPNIGGVAIFLGFILAILAGSFFLPSLIGDVIIDDVRIKLLSIVLGATFMCLVGFIDDMWEVPVSLRLATQLVAAGLLVMNGIKITFITDYFGNQDYLFFTSEVLATTITLLWIVGFTNAFNFIDGLDGLSSGIAAISSLALLAVAVNFSNPSTSAAMLLLAAIAGASLGFLRHNFNPAKIIMGDSGAYTLGYVLAAVSVLGALKVTALVSVATPVLILGLPVVNITQVTIKRMLRGRSPAMANNDHIHDIIRERSGSKRLTVIILWCATLALGTIGMFLSKTPPELIYLTIAGTVTLIAVVCFLRFKEAEAEQKVQDSLRDGSI